MLPTPTRSGAAALRRGALTAPALPQPRVALPAAAPLVAAVATTILLCGGAGAALVALGVTLYALWIVLQKRALRRLRAIDMTVWATWFGAAFSLPFSTGLPHALATAPTGALLGLLALGVVVTTIPFMLW